MYENTFCVFGVVQINFFLQCAVLPESPKRIALHNLIIHLCNRELLCISYTWNCMNELHIENYSIQVYTYDNGIDSDGTYLIN